jgi:hypothetical protein
MKKLIAALFGLVLATQAHAQGTFFGTNPMIFSTGVTSLTEAMRIDSGQHVSLNGPAQDTFNNLQILTTTANGGNGIGLYAWNTNNSQSTISFFDSRSGVAGVNSAVHSGDWLGDIEFYGDTGSGFALGARINGVADAAFGNPGNGAPTRIEFWTTAQGSVAPTSRLRIDNVGNIIQGGVGAIPSIFGDQPTIQVNSSSNVPAGLMSFAAWVNNAGTSPGLYFTKSRNASIGTHTAVQNNDSLGFIIATGSDGTSFNSGPSVQMQFFVDGSVSTNIVPGRFVVSTENSTGALLERMRIDSGGFTTFGGNGANVSIASAQAYVQTVLPANTSAWHFSSVAFGNFAGDAGYSFAKTRGANATTQSALNNNDLIVEFDIYGSDGVAYRPAAQITAAADAAFSSGSSPGRLAFLTTPSGSTTLVEAMRIDNTGLMTLGFNGGAGASVHQLLFNDFKNTGSGRPDIVMNWGASGYVGIGPATNLADNILRIGRVNNPGTDFASALSVFILASDNFGIIRNGQSTPDTLLSSPAAATLQLGFTDAAAPVAQTLQVQSVVTGTNNTAGADWTLIGSRGTGTGAGGNIIVKTVPAGGSGTSQNTATEALRVDSNQNVNIGSIGTIISDLFGNAPRLQVSHAGASSDGLDVRRYNAAAAGPDIIFTHSRSGTIGTNTGLNSADEVGALHFAGYDATGTPAIREAATITAAVDAAPTAGSVPGRIVLATAASGAGSPSEAMRIDSKRHVNYTTANPTASACAGFALGTGSSDTAGRVTFTSATSCAISFGTAFTNAPFCTVAPGSAASTVTVTTSTTVLTATFGTANTSMFYQCFGS